MFTRAAVGHSERHALYLLQDHLARPGASPKLLLATTGKSPTEQPQLIAVTDLDGDGHVELVLEWEDYSVPVRTALVQVGAEGLRTLASWSCTERGIVGERVAPCCG